MFKFNIVNPNLENLGYLKAIANIKDKHDRSTPSNFHWKILKCRMIIFSASSVLACPDKNDEKQVHIIFNKIGRDYDCITSLFLKFSLQQFGNISKVTPETYLMCFKYTLTARIAPAWNIVGYNYLINNRDFLTVTEPQPGIQYHVSINDESITLEVKAVKIHFVKSKEEFASGELVRVLPSLNKAVIEERCDSLPSWGDFKCYKDLRRHWKNIHGYRLPEKEFPYYSVQFWRGEPLTYPEVCLTRMFPIITPCPKPTAKSVVAAFIDCVECKMQNVFGKPLRVDAEQTQNTGTSHYVENVSETQAVSLCTPSQSQPEPRFKI